MTIYHVDWDMWDVYVMSTNRIDKVIDKGGYVKYHIKQTICFK